MTDNDAGDSNPHDSARTMRDHAGEAIVDTRNWPGYLCIGAALAAMGLTLTAAASGFEGWGWIGTAVTVALFVVGIGLVLLERRRVKAREGKDFTDPSGH